MEVKYRNHVSGDEVRLVARPLPAGTSLTVITQQGTARSDRIVLVPFERWLLNETA